MSYAKFFFSFRLDKLGSSTHPLSITAIKNKPFVNRIKIKVTNNTTKTLRTLPYSNNLNQWRLLPLNWHLDKVLLLAVPKKDGWGGLSDGLWVMVVVVSRRIGGKMQGAL